jgi:hypothetical protein
VGFWLQAAMMQVQERTGVGEVKGVRCSTRVQALFYRVRMGKEVLRCLQFLAMKRLSMPPVTGEMKRGNEGGDDAVMFSLQRRWSREAMGAAQSRPPVVASTLCFGAGGRSQLGRLGQKGRVGQ